jgi:hypothetical protein
MSDDTKRPVELLDSGDVVQNKKGKQTHLAKFEVETGALEFDSDEISQKYREEIISAIQDDEEKTGSSGLFVKSYSIKGREKVSPSPKAPPCPTPKSVLGDKDPAVVKWYFKYDLPQAIIRYRVHTDKNGDPITSQVRRVTKVPREDPATGAIDFEHAKVEETDEGIIADRATCLTFLPTDIVGAAVAGGGDES